MLISRFIKKSLCAALSISILFAFSACTETNDVFTQTEDENLNSVSETEYTYFTQTEDGNLVSASGTEYEFLAREGSLYYFGDLIFQGSVEGEEKTSQHMGHSYQTGLFSIENDETHNILIRRAPNDEWFSIY